MHQSYLFYSLKSWECSWKKESRTTVWQSICRTDEICSTPACWSWCLCSHCAKTVSFSCVSWDLLKFNTTRTVQSSRHSEEFCYNTLYHPVWDRQLKLLLAIKFEGSKELWVLYMLDTVPRTAFCGIAIFGCLLDYLWNWLNPRD